MSKFETYEPQPRDFWRTTDPNAFPPLFPYISGSTYFEPCWGAGDLERGLIGVAACVLRSDIAPQVEGVLQKNALDLTEDDVKGCDYGVSNPPFGWEMLQPLLEHLPTLRPTWLLLPADFMHNKRARPYMDRCSSLVSIGRMYFHKSGEDPSEVNYSRGTANNCWYLFHDHNQSMTNFIGWTSK
jgi:hypothetical protein